MTSDPRDADSAPEKAQGSRYAAIAAASVAIAAALWFLIDQIGPLLSLGGGFVLGGVAFEKVDKPYWSAVLIPLAILVAAVLVLFFTRLDGS